MAAPATAIVGYDLDFARTLPKLAPRAAESLSEKLADDPEQARFMAMRSAGLQGGYFIVAARALGLDCGPMSGFDRDGVDKEFFAGTAIKSYFLCNLGYGDPGSVAPARRAPRLRRSLQDSLVKILAVDTALGACSVALLEGEQDPRPYLRSRWTAAMPNGWRRWSTRRCRRRGFFRARPPGRHDRPRHLHRPARRAGLHARLAAGAENSADRRHHPGSHGRRRHGRNRHDQSRRDP